MKIKIKSILCILLLFCTINFSCSGDSIKPEQLRINSNSHTGSYLSFSYERNSMGFIPPDVTLIFSSKSKIKNKSNAPLSEKKGFILLPLGKNSSTLESIDLSGYKMRLDYSFTAESGKIYYIGHFRFKSTTKTMEISIEDNYENDAVKIRKIYYPIRNLEIINLIK